MRRAVYPGTFDPPTKGHQDIATRALAIFDELIIAVTDNTCKNVLFSAEERIQFWKDIFPGESRIKIVSFNCLLVDFVRQNDAVAVVRGLRAISDFEYEVQMAAINHDLASDIDTVFFTARGKQLFISSTVVKEIARFGGDISDKAPICVCRALEEKFSKNKF